MGPKMRNQDEGRRGQPLQEREPLPGAQDEESRPKRPAWATSTRSRATARGPRRGIKTQEAGVGNLYKIESHCPGPKRRNRDPRGRREQPLQNREPLPGAQDEESRPK